MSIQLALLKSGEDVIADIKEYRDADDKLVSYLFRDPYIIKIKTSQLLVEEDSTPKHEVIYYKWISLSKDSDIIVNKDWVVCITDPLDSITKSYEGRINGRNGSSNRRDADDSRTGKGSGTESDTSVVPDEQSSIGLTD
tara:strand:+ start:312 stop:728 length:417 start_codon:yes stop_codon:yes gene_type:complete